MGEVGEDVGLEGLFNVDVEALFDGEELEGVVFGEEVDLGVGGDDACGEGAAELVDPGFLSVTCALML